MWPFGFLDGSPRPKKKTPEGRSQKRVESDVRTPGLETGRQSDALLGALVRHAFVRDALRFFCALGRDGQPTGQRFDCSTENIYGCRRSQLVPAKSLNGKQLHTTERNLA